MADAKLVIGVAGRIGSGKTEIARLLESGFGFQYLRYSLVLADWQRTDPAAKTLLQQVGWAVMSSSRQRELNQRLIAQIDRQRDCVVDGLRHPIDFESLSASFEPCFGLVYVDTPEEIRFQRLKTRFSTYEGFIAADQHPVESKITSLKPVAAAVIAGSLSTESTVFELERIINGMRLRCFASNNPPSH